MGTNACAYDYDPIGDQKSAKPKAQPPGDRDFEAARRRGARSGIPRRSGNRYRRQSAVAAGSGEACTNTYAANVLNQYVCVTNSAFSASPRETIPAYPDKNCKPVFLDPCYYDVEAFKQAVKDIKSEDARNPALEKYDEVFNICFLWRGKTIEKAKKRAKGCTRNRNGGFQT